MRSLALAFVSMAIVVGCDSSEAGVLVELRTDYVPGAEYVVALFPDSTPRYLRLEGGSGQDLTWAVACGPAAVYSTGLLVADADFGGGLRTTAGNLDAFLVGRDLDGTHIFSRLFGGSGSDNGRGIAVSSDGPIFVGSFDADVTFDAATVTPVGDVDAFVAALDFSGSLRWLTSFGSAGWDAAFDAAVDDLGRVYVVGQGSGAIDFGGGPRMPVTSPDAFVAAYDSDGNHVWSRVLGGTGVDGLNQVAPFPGGGVIVIGSFEDTIGLGSGVTLRSEGGQDAFIARLDSTGETVWAMRIGGSMDVAGNGVSVVGSDIFVAGSFEGSISVGEEIFDSVALRDRWVAGVDEFGRIRGAIHLGGEGDDPLFSVAADPRGGTLYVASIVQDADIGFDALSVSAVATP